MIKETYEYLYKQLDEKILKNMLKKKHGSDMVDNLKYVDILKVIRDQVLNSTFVSISTKNKDQAYNIFEILNAKGKRLAHIDLIKNKLFEVLKQTEPVDFAEDYWNKTKKVLNSGKESVGIATFYRHFWISKYKKSTSNKMYDDFVIVRKDVESYKNFMIDMYNNAENYIKIINPTREDYENRKEYYWLVQSLNVLNNYFNIVQVRIALLALYDLKKRKIIELKDLKRAVIYLENFHFAYNAIISGRSNRFESIYSKFAIKLSKCTKRTEARECIEESLIKELDRIYPSYKDFKDKFIELAYSKKNIKGNVKTKYALNKLNAYYSGKEIFEDDSSIEHIISETRGIQTLNIGNLILLESKLNEEADNLCYEDKIKIYKKSQYAWVNQFIMEHDSWEESDFLNRAEHLAKVYYQKILNRNI